MDEVGVKYLGNKSFQAQSGEHTFIIENPPEVFMASLGSCIGVYITRYCKTAKLNTDGLEIRLGWSLSDDKSKIKSINVKIELPNAEVGKRRDALLQVAHHCLIHNTIQNPPEIKMSLKARDIS